MRQVKRTQTLNGGWRRSVRRGACVWLLCVAALWACDSEQSASPETPSASTQERHVDEATPVKPSPAPEPIIEPDLDEANDDNDEVAEEERDPPRAEERRIRPRRRVERPKRRRERPRRDERAPSHKPRLEVIEATLAANVEDRKPVGKGTRFTTDTDKVWAWIKVRNTGDGPSPVTMIWKHEGREIFSTDLKIGVSKGWRTWTRKTISDKQTGPWSVEVRDQEGKLLKTLKFRIEEPTKTAERPRAVRTGDATPPKTIQ
ncbi:MAG: hypothetical protein CMH57_11230 [Myxococcales bacterium]|nr:hypothetical protein [Myxococcales bacterium]